MFKVKWTDDEMFDKLMPMINERLVRGDVPLNMNAASMVTHAFLFTGEDKYKQWVLDYLQAWVERAMPTAASCPTTSGPAARSAS